MKFTKIIFSLLLLANVLLGKAQGSKGIPETGCPPGFRSVITVDIDVFNFHRPKYDCEKGFFICIRGVHVYGDCIPYDTRFDTYVKEGQVHGYSVLLNGQVELHLPAELAELPQYAKEDMSVFSVEKDWIEIYFKDKKIGTMKEGDYEVKRAGNELVITVDLI